jgi:pyruvate dehydrogenase E2 component (dihydrolipoamide acetyltransferase)
MDGTLLNWLKNVGDAVKTGDVIAEMDSDKATVEIEAPADGVIVALTAKIGDALQTGAIIGMVGEASEAPASVGASPVTQAATGPQIPPVATPAPAKSNGAPSLTPSPSPSGRGEVAATREDGQMKASPLARKLAEENGVNLSQVQGSGPGGRIVKEDVELFMGKAVEPRPRLAPSAPAIPSQPAAAPTAPAPIPPPAAIVPPPARKLPEGADVEIVDLTNMRKRIVAVTVESKQQVPHFYVTTEVDVEALLALRQQLNGNLPDGAAKISVNDLIVKAAALTLRKFPNLNAHYYGDKIVRHKRINIGIAVALPNGGLMYVVTRDADRLALGAMAQMNKDMIARAREGKVKVEDITGATFSTSNLGPYDVEHFSAIINPPEAGILAVGTAQKLPVVKPDGSLGVGTRMKATISVDHRVSDGAEGAQFLQAFKALIESPMRLLV